VLFLDELTEFRRDAIEAIRQPLEDGRVVVTRIVGSVEFPARFTLVAALTLPLGASSRYGHGGEHDRGWGRFKAPDMTPDN
jgi:predicted ATPase with chaperone activity